MVPSTRIINLLHRSRIPVLLSDEDTYSVAAKIRSMTCKIEYTDRDKIHEAIRIVEKHVDIDAIIKNL